MVEEYFQNAYMSTWCDVCLLSSTEWSCLETSSRLIEWSWDQNKPLCVSLPTVSLVSGNHKQGIGEILGVRFKWESPEDGCMENLDTEDGTENTRFIPGDKMVTPTLVMLPNCLQVPALQFSLVIHFNKNFIFLKTKIFSQENFWRPLDSSSHSSVENMTSRKNTASRHWLEISGSERTNCFYSERPSYRQWDSSQ